MTRFLAQLVLAASLVTAGWLRADSGDEPYLGLAGAGVNDEIVSLLRKATGDTPPKGFFVGAVRSYGPAADIMQAYDIVAVINGAKIESTEDYLHAVSGLKIGEPCTLLVSRAIKRGNRTSWRRAALKVTPTSKRAALMAEVDAVEDDVLGLTVYRHKDAPSVGGPTACTVYFATDGGKPGPLMCRMQFRGDEMTMDVITMKAGTKTFELKPPPFSVKRDYKGVWWEWYDFLITPAQMLVFDEMLANGETTIRLSGREYKHDHKPDYAEVDRIRIVMELRDLMRADK